MARSHSSADTFSSSLEHYPYDQLSHTFFLLCVAFLSIGTKAYYMYLLHSCSIGRIYGLCKNLKLRSTGKSQRYTREWVSRSIKSGLLMSERDFFLLVGNWNVRLDYM